MPVPLTHCSGSNAPLQWATAVMFLTHSATAGTCHMPSWHDPKSQNYSNRYARMPSLQLLCPGPTTAGNQAQEWQFTPLGFPLQKQVYVYWPFHPLLSHVVNICSHFYFFCSTISPGNCFVLKSLWIQVFLSTFSLYLLEKLAICPGQVSSVGTLLVASPWCGWASSLVPVFFSIGNCIQRLDQIPGWLLGQRLRV